MMTSGELFLTVLRDDYATDCGKGWRNAMMRAGTARRSAGSAVGWGSAGKSLGREKQREADELLFIDRLMSTFNRSFYLHVEDN